MQLRRATLVSLRTAEDVELNWVYSLLECTLGKLTSGASSVRRHNERYTISGVRRYIWGRLRGKLLALCIVTSLAASFRLAKSCHSELSTSFLSPLRLQIRTQFLDLLRKRKKLEGLYRPRIHYCHKAINEENVRFNTGILHLCR